MGAVSVFLGQVYSESDAARGPGFCLSPTLNMRNTITTPRFFGCLPDPGCIVRKW